jgi:hypothetical protein
MALRTAAKFAAEGCLVKPLLLQFFQDETISFDFRLKTEWTRNREPDGWFHASSHPSMTEDELVAYLTLPQKREPMTYVGTMSTLFGSVVHAVVRSSLDQMGVLVPLPPGDCITCGHPRSGKSACYEHGALDKATHSRGHLDGILSLGRDGVRGLDIKTIKMWGTYGLKDAPDMDLAYFRQTWPKYYAQGQDYMRMTGLRQFIVFFMALGNPWEMREYHFNYDHEFAFGIETRYRNALRRAAVAA